MTRPLRIRFEGAVYHITSRGNARATIFKDNNDWQEFLEILKRVIRRYRWVCHGYCLMDNHYHLIIETPMGNISEGMRQLNGTYTQYFNRRYKSVGHIFQGRFKGILIERDEYLLEVISYVVLNPVRVKKCKSASEYKWSSYRETVGLKKTDSFLFTDWVLAQFSDKRSEAVKEYIEYVNEGREVQLWDRLIGQVYYGGKRFIEKVTDGVEVLKEVPRIQCQPLRPDLKEVLKEEHGILKAYRDYGYRMKEIAEELDVHYATVSRRLKRIEDITHNV